METGRLGSRFRGDARRLSDTPPRAFQIEAYGDIARDPPLLPLRRTIRGMWDQMFTLQNKRWEGNPTVGAWQWLREE